MLPGQHRQTYQNRDLFEKKVIKGGLFIRVRMRVGKGKNLGGEKGK